MLHIRDLLETLASFVHSFFVLECLSHWVSEKQQLCLMGHQ